jgi:hypothetical protein
LAKILNSLGIFLIATAALKAFRPSNADALEVAYELPQALMVFVVQAELFVGTWLLLRVWPRGAWWAAIGLFTGFAGFSLYRGLAGYETCGCFGSFAVNPWWTFTFDIFILGSLLLIGPAVKSMYGSALRSTKVLVGGIACAAMSVTALVLMVSQPAITEITDGDAVGSGLVILEPVEWVGRELPILKWLTPPVDVAAGEWTIVMVHHDCPTCLAAIPKYQALARGGGLGDSGRLLFVEVPPYGDLPVDAGGQIARARLSAEKEWFVQTPVEIQLLNGRVKAASTDLPLVGGAH